MISTANGISYVIYNPNDIIQKCILNGKQWNDTIVKIIQSYIHIYKLKHFLNVGSHIGTISLPVSTYINKVTAVEAYPPTYNHLCKNIEINSINNISSLNIALGNSEEDIYFMSDNAICPIERINRVVNNTGGMHVFTEEDIKNKTRSAGLTDRKIKNKMNKLDNIAIEPFDIMLVDIEGCEHEFLLGARETILKNKPFIIIEIWSDTKRKYENMKLKQQDIINYIISLNYKLVRSIQDDFIFEPI